MKKYNIGEFKNGWIVGDFTPSIIKTKKFEFLVRFYKKGDTDAKHVHKVADEITVAVSGKFKLNGIELNPGDIIHIPPNESAVFECFEDGATAVVKTPSVIGDKYLVE